MVCHISHVNISSTSRYPIALSSNKSSLSLSLWSSQATNCKNTKPQLPFLSPLSLFHPSNSSKFYSILSWESLQIRINVISCVSGSNTGRYNYSIETLIFKYHIYIPKKRKIGKRKNEAAPVFNVKSHSSFLLLLFLSSLNCLS